MPDSTWETLIETLGVFGIIGGIILGVQSGHIYYSISVVSSVGLIVTDIRKRKRIARFYKEKVKEQWGKTHIENRDFLHIRKLYDLPNTRGKGNFIIDDITWRDLNMNEVFSKIDHTKSMVGMQYLYNVLRNPIFNENILKARKNRVNFLLYKKDLAQKIQYPLSTLGKKENEEIFAYFKDGLNVDTSPLIWYRILSYSFYISVILLIFNLRLGSGVLVFLLMINGGIYQRNKLKIAAEIDIFHYISNFLKCASDISKIDTEGIDIRKERLRDLLKETKQIYKNVSSLKSSEVGRTELQIIMDYINMFTLREGIVFYKTVDLINEYREQLFEIYNHIGEIDTYISIASYKDSLKHHVEPTLIKNSNKFYLKTEDIYHPLLTDGVPYTFEFDNKGALITGSNASGKSTFLRTIGINALFAQTLYLTLAKDYRASSFKLLTSIGTTDNIVEGDSYFMAEAKSLKRIIDTVDNNQTVLCILDEIFRGTNTAERIGAASEVLDYMSNKNCLVVAATHDLELTTMVNNRYENYHFKEIIRDKDIIFDYILRHGPTTSRNAIAILRYLDYPKEIYENANNKMKTYEVFNFDKTCIK